MKVTVSKVFILKNMKSESTEESAAATVEKEIEENFCIFANIWVIWVNWVNLDTVPGKYRKAKDGSPEKRWLARKTQNNTFSLELFLLNAKLSAFHFPPITTVSKIYFSLFLFLSFCSW